MSDTLADRIRDRLKTVGKSAAAASVEAGHNAGYIGDILKGKAKNPRSDTMQNLATVLEVSVDWLLHGDGEPPPPKLAAKPTSNLRMAQMALPARNEMPRDVEVLGTAAGSLAGAFQFEGEVVDRVARPPGLANAAGVYALYVEGTSMMPVHNPGDLRFVNANRHPSIGDSVIITAKYTENGPVESFIKILVRRSGQSVTVQQLNPQAEIEFSAKYVVSMHKVLTMNDLFGV